MFTDTHCHLSCIDPDKIATGDMAKRALEKRVTLVIDISTGLDNFIKRQRVAGDLTARYPLEVYLTAGIPPYYADRRKGKDIDNVRRQCLEERRVVAVGEIGLDYYHDYGTRKQQQDLFIEQIELAGDISLPVVVHSRDADEDLVNILSSYTPKSGAIIHCFSSGHATASRLLDLGFVLSFAGNITYKQSDDIRAVVRAVPQGSFVIETDSPYLPPEGMRGRPNEPANVAVIAEFVAALREESLETVAETTTATAKRLFGIGEKSE